MENTALEKEVFVKHNRFPGLLDGEEVKLIMRKHKVTLIPFSFVVLLIALIPLLMVSLFFSTINLGQITNALLITSGLGAFYLGLYTTAFIYFINHRYDIGVVTNLRVLDVNQSAVFCSTFSEVPLSEIKDVKGEIEGIFGYLFHYGRITIQITGSKHRFIFNAMPNVYKTVQEITQLHMDQLGELYSKTTTTDGTLAQHEELLPQSAEKVFESFLLQYLSSPEYQENAHNPFCKFTHKYGICAQKLSCPYKLESAQEHHHTAIDSLHDSLHKLIN
jgi:hypothetical protein